jgi:hypothetical protein
MPRPPRRTHVKILKLFPLLALLLLPLAAAAANPIDGTWEGIFKYPGGNPDLKVRFNFKVDGDKVTGSVDSKKGPAPIISGTASGNMFTFKVAINDVVIEHTCTLSGDTISTLVTFGGQQPTTMTLTRVVGALPPGPTPTGHWHWTVTPPGHDRTYEVSANLVYSDGVLTGSYHGRFGDAYISNATFKAGVVAFSVVRQYEGKPYILSYSGTLDGDTLTGTVAIPAYDGTVATTIDWKADRRN